MDVDASQFWSFQDGGGQEQAVGSDHGDIKCQIMEGCLFGRIAKGQWRSDVEAQFQRAVMHRRAPFLAPAPGRSGRLAVNSNDVVTCLGQRIECRNRKRRSTHESKAQSGQTPSRSFDFFSLESLRRIMPRRTAER